MGRRDRIESIEEWATDQYDTLVFDFESAERDASLLLEAEETKRIAAEVLLAGRVVSTDALERLADRVDDLRSALAELEDQWEAVELAAIRRLPPGYEDYISLSELRREKPEVVDVLDQLQSDVEDARASVDSGEAASWILADVDVPRKLLESIATELFGADAAWFISAFDARDERAPEGVLTAPPMPDETASTHLVRLYEDFAVKLETMGDEPLDGGADSANVTTDLQSWLEWLEISIDELGHDDDRVRAGAALTAVLLGRSTGTLSLVVDSVERWMLLPSTRHELVEEWAEADVDEEERWRRSWLHRHWLRRGQVPPLERPEVPMSPAMQARQLEAQRKAEEAAAAAKLKELRRKREEEEAAAAAKLDERRRKKEERANAVRLLEELATTISERAGHLDVKVDRKKLNVVAGGEFDSMTLTLIGSGADVGYQTAKTSMSGDIAVEDVADGVLDPVLNAL